MYAIDAATIKGVEILSHRRGVATVAASARRRILTRSRDSWTSIPSTVHGRRHTEGREEKATTKNDKSLIYDEAGVQRWMTTTMKSSSTATKISAFFARTRK